MKVVEIGKKSTQILEVLKHLETQTRVPIHVHLSHSLLGLNLSRKARVLFSRLKLDQSEERIAILILIQIRKRKFVILSDQVLHQKIGQAYWDELSKNFRRDLHFTHFDNALLLFLKTLGITLAWHFPKSH